MVTTVNAAVEAFVRATAVEPLNVRVNAVSPGWVAETLQAMGRDPAPGIPPPRLHKPSCGNCAKDRRVRLRCLLAAESTKARLAGIPVKLCSK